MAEPAISVSMSAYNSASFLREAIESMLAQTFGDFEFLIVNDGSTDGSGAIIDEYAALDSRIVAIHQENRGVATSLNRMTEMARAPWIARMDSDDISLPDRLASQMRFLTAHPEHGLLGGNVQVIDNQGRILDRAPIDRPLTNEAITANFKEGANLHHPTIVVATDLLRKVGGYRKPFRFAQDYDLYLRLWPHTKMANLEDVLLLYRLHSEQASTKHLMGQTLSAVVAWLSHEARQAGSHDPVDSLDTLPAVGTLDALFGVEGADSYARKRIMERIIYSPDILAGEGFGVMVEHIRETGSNSELWRVIPRLLRAGHAGKAARLGATLALA